MKKKLLLSIFVMAFTVSSYAQSTTLKLSTADSTSTFKVTNSNDSILMKLNGDNGFYMGGTFGTGAIPDTGASTRFMWYPAKAAFRAGYVDGAQWNYANVGSYSIAMGYNTTASGDYGSTAMGAYTTASGTGSIAMGDEAIDSGYYSIAMGSSTTAGGDYSTAIGWGTTASGGYGSTAMGCNTTASGGTSTAMGWSTTASGKYSTAMGFNTTASGRYSTAMGYYVSTNSKKGSFIIGDHSATTKTSSTANDQMTMRFAGGYRLFTNSGASIGVSLAAGGNSWSQISDSTKKYAFLPVNGESVLKKINKFNLRTWSYKGQDSTKFRHYGPMAQEFFTAFGHDKYGVAGNDTTINQADFMGINLIAIQALYRKTKKLKSEVTRQKQLISRLQKTEEENTILKNKVAYLEKAMSEQNSKIASQQQFMEKMVGNMTAIASKLKTLENDKSELSYNDKAKK